MKNNTLCFKFLTLSILLLIPALSIQIWAVSATECDLTHDYLVNNKDLSVVAQKWLLDCSVNDCNGADLDDSNSVDFADFALFAQHWRANLTHLIPPANRDFVEDSFIDTKDLGAIIDKWLLDCSVVDCNGTDLNESGTVNFLDIALFAQFWLTRISVPMAECDFVEDCWIDWKDLAAFVDKWMADCTVVDCNGADLNDSNSVEFDDFRLFAQHWTKSPDYDCVWEFIQQQWTNTMNELSTNPIYWTTSPYCTGPDCNYPRGTDKYGTYVPAGEWYPKGINPNPTNEYTHWAGGFVPGSLWYLYQKTGDQKWRDWAEAWTHGLANEPNRIKDHESGFTVYRSFGLGYQLTGNPDYKTQVIKAAENLMLRYDPNVGCIKSWALIENPKFEVITDGMMMLEMVFWAIKNGGDPNWYDKLISHCYKTMENNVRPNGSNWQIVEYNPTNGDVIVKWGKQSIYDVNLPKGSFETTWSRGQAWGVNGFTMAYRETGDPNMLITAKKMADYFINHLQEDYIPFWDVNAPDYPGWVDAKETSAPAIAASGLLELSTHVSSQDDKEKYYNAACNILDSLCSPAYLAKNTNSMGLLLHSIGNGNRPWHVEFDTSLMYGDHFFIEALLRRESIPPP